MNSRRAVLRNGPSASDIVFRLCLAQFSCLKSHSSGNILHIGQQLLISVSNLKQVKKWVKPGTNFGPLLTDGGDGE